MIMMKRIVVLSGSESESDEACEMPDSGQLWDMVKT
jgi:hypothetical protein